MRQNDKGYIMREVNRFCAIVQGMYNRGKITKAQLDRNLDAAVEVEACMPVFAYERIEWTDLARRNFAAIVKFNSNI